MSRILLYFASGESLYPGAAMLLLAIFISFLKGSWVLPRNVLAWMALIIIVMACPPFSFAVDLIFLALFLFWFISSNQNPQPTTIRRLKIGSGLSLATLLLVLAAFEFAHREMPTIDGGAIDQIAVIGDSISSGLNPSSAPWPTVLQQSCSVEVRNLAKPGALVSDGLQMTAELKDSDHFVLIELGGNDLLMGVPSDEYRRDLEALLSKITANGRSVVMFELPLMPNRIVYGQVQRSLSAKYGVLLIPKRYFAQAIRGADATTDGLHLSAYGAHRMAGIVTQISPALLSRCRFSSSF